MWDGNVVSRALQRFHGAGLRQALVAAVAGGGLVFSVVAHATDVATRPLQGALLVEPNIVFVIDNSGSMDAEILLSSKEGAMYWNPNTATAWNGSGPLDEINNVTTQRRKLFPQLGVSAGTGVEPLNSALSQAVPPTAQFAWLRSSAYNKLYYDPAVVYRPWEPAIFTTSGTPPTTYQVTYGPAVATAAKTHPSDTLSPLTINLVADQDLVAGPPPTLATSAALPGKRFKFLKGMKFPPLAKWVNTDGTLGTSATGTATGQADIAVTYYPATYWVRGTCTPVNDVNCTAAPEAGTGQLKRVEIRSTTATYTQDLSRTDCAQISGGQRICTFAEESQNFANWFQYYRKRKHMLSAAMGQVMAGLGEGLRLGSMYFTVDAAQPDISMVSTSGPTSAAVRQKFAGYFYNESRAAPTPTLGALKFVGEQFDNNTGIIQHACQRNNAFVMTDGAYTDTIALPAYSTGYGAGAPYAPTASGTLADMALYYYAKQLRSTGPNSLAAGRVPKGDPLRPNPDLNANLHLNTYAVTVGIEGSNWPGNDADKDNLPDTSINWPSAPAGRDRIDDVWHATINGRGHMLLANNAQEMAATVSRVLFDVSGVQGAQGSASVSSVNLSSNDFALLGSFNAGRWFGDLKRHAINPATGAIAPTQAWSAAVRLDAAVPADRVLVTQGAVFDAVNVGSLVNPADPSGSSPATLRMVDYLRGARGDEGFGSAKLRPRSSRFGAVIGSVAASNQARTVGFVAANDGFMHAIDLADGSERWAYAPRAALAKMGESTQVNWGFKTVHDGSPVIGTVGTTEMLFGGLGSGGNGWYGIDISQAAQPLNAAARASTIRWELPAAGSPQVAQMGLAVGRPLLVKTQTPLGQVLLLSSGYNAPANDRKGRLFVVKPDTGQVIHTVETPQLPALPGMPNYDPGLAQLTAFREVDGTVRYVYGGDEHGNLWRFDLSSMTAATPPTVGKLATLKDSAGAAQPITVAPALVEYQGKRIVMVGTGRLLGYSDFAPEIHGNSFYAIHDDGNELADSRGGALIGQALTANADGTRSLANPQPVDWNAKRGWFIDLPTDERANIAPLVGITAVAFVTNQPGTDPCAMKAYRYGLGVATGAAIQADVVGEVVTEHGAVGNILVRNTDGSVGGDVRGGDGSVTPYLLEGPSGLTPRKAGWRRVVR